MRTTTFHNLLLLPAVLRPGIFLASATPKNGPKVHDDDNGLFSFRSRPDLRAPKWEVEVYDQAALAPGYWFFGPYETLNMDDSLGNGWIGPHIYAQDGSLVWSGAALFDNGNIEDFRLSNVDGVEMMTLMDQRHSKGVFMDKHFQVKDRKMANGPSGGGFNSHEFHFVENGTRALVVYGEGRSFSKEEAKKALGFGETCKVACDGIHEREVKGWKSTWEWNSCDHIGLEQSSYKVDYLNNQCSGKWDYIHANSIDKTPEGDYLYSGRHTNSIYKISHANGTVLWRLGGTSGSNFTHRDDFTFSRQHDVRYRGANATHTFISFLDNAKGLDANEPTHPFSRGLLIALDEKNMQAEIAAHYDHPDGEGGLAFRRGNYQPLDNGNVFMCWSERALQSEHTKEGKMLMQARLRVDWLGTYRAYKFEFEGTPADPPDAVGEVVEEDGRVKTNVFVSWNGATEVNSYKLFRTRASGHPLMLVDSQTKQGFETTLSYEGYAKYAVVKALHANGTVLGQTKLIRIAGLNETIPEEDPQPPVSMEDPYWYSDIGFFLGAGALFAICAAAVVLITRRLRRGAGGPRRSLLDLLSRGRYQRLGEGDRELQDREGKESLMGRTRRRGSDDDVFAERFSLGEESEGEGRGSDVEVEGGEEFRRR
ncbi:uncharacterized protein LTR77_010458 [Saxophila tyrrhenica]|uniref:ASST-domain-containing protein n=1 Tax=Saxophila tyrrhenica TaxID=1690608 RepID=A0AAV9NZF3_9PEZI|nr:hypothetical protein LTR77_010458 [Saxophila tyrrhenica]